MNARAAVLVGAVVLVGVVAAVNSRRASQSRLGVIPGPARPSLTLPVLPRPGPQPGALGCISWPSPNASEEASISFSPRTHSNLLAVSARCSNAAGTEYASLVEVRDLDHGRRIIGVLIAPQQHVHVVALSADRGGVTVDAAEEAATDAATGQSSPELGSVFERRFVASATGFTALAPKRIAPACRPADLQVAVIESGPASAVLQFLNSSPRACAIEGFPSVQGISTTGRTLRARERRVDPSVLLVQPGARVSATIDFGILSSASAASAASACQELSKLRVGLPGVRQIAELATRMEGCELVVSPFLSG